MYKTLIEFNKLRNMQGNLEKNERLLVEQLSSTHPKAEISELYTQIATSNKMYKEKLQADTSDIARSLRSVKDILKNDIENIDINVMKKDMTAIQRNLTNLERHTKSTLDVLLKEEDQLLDELESFEKKMNEWDKPTSLRKSAIKKVSASIVGNVPEEIVDFSKFLEANGGHENGWSTEDHVLFLKVRCKTKNAKQLAEILNSMLPDITHEEVLQHENWYKKYLELRAKQKQAIKKWKEGKVKVKSPIETQPKPKLISSRTEFFQKEETKYKLSAWKAEKLAQTRTESEQKQQELHKRKQHERQQKLKQRQVKKELDQWKQVKAEAERAERLQKQIEEQREKEHRAAKANKLIKEFQRQDEGFLHRKLQMRLSQSKNEIVKVNPVEAPRDPKRLLKPTKQWILRTYGAGDEGKVFGSLPLQAIPKLAVPEWRKSVL